ncbi:MAG: hypothetical protein LBT09_08415 [Planctomycetaceae bacterium]|jgi:hypothetical protein|nr:hypothetical protein [Planctomycetaceae bacterium]
MKYQFRNFLILFTVFFGSIIAVDYCRIADADVVVADVGRWKINSVKIGIEGCYKNGLWTAAVVNLTMPESEIVGGKIFSVSINSIDSDGTPITYRKNFSDVEVGNLSASDKTQLGTDGVINFTATVYFKPGRHNAKISVNLESNGKNNATTTLAPTEKTTQLPQKNSTDYSYNNSNSPANAAIFLPPIPHERRIILIIGNEDIGLQGAIAELALREERRPLIVKINSVAELPDQWFGYEAVDMIVLTTTEPEQFKNLNAKSPQIIAINKWIKLGGHLFFCAGRDSEVLIKKKNETDLFDAPLAPFLSGKFEKMTSIRKGDLLETFVLSKRKIQIESANEFLIMPLLSNPQGLIRLRDGDMPIVSQRLHGFGMITYFGGDLSGKPLGNWRDRTTLVRKILRWDINKQNTARQDMSIVRPAYNDVSGQIRSAADRFDEIKIVPFSLILIILVVYWFVVGIGDWFIVRKLLKRPMLTWVTFPFWILLFSVVSFVFVINGRPNQAILREVVVVDLNPEHGLFRCSVWGNLYSPLDTHYSLGLQDNNNLSGNLSDNSDNLSDNLSGKNSHENISVTKNSGNETGNETALNSGEINSAETSSGVADSNMFVDGETLFFSWQGLTGDGLGGMSPKTFNPTVWRDGSLQDKLASIENVPIQIRSTKSFYGERFGTNKNFTAIKSKLFSDEGLPVGELYFDGVPKMKDVVLVYGRWLMPLGNTPNRGQITIDKKSQRRDIGDILLSKIAMDDESLRQIANYNTRSTDAAYIVKTLSVHEQLGGYETIGLFNTFQRALDMSNILATNHAVLIGEFESDQIAPDGIKVSVPVVRHTKTILRQVLPVTPTKTRTILESDKKLEQNDPTIKLKLPIKESEM